MTLHINAEKTSEPVKKGQEQLARKQRSLCKLRHPPKQACKLQGYLCGARHRSKLSMPQKYQHKCLRPTLFLSYTHDKLDQ
jgi:hypothetical protein